ncbi:hypothetical protein N836_20720 [Leptolyngbya sp. Heron Island J]|nr:hypothetical protein N836_20720 [Leptolyngbya sp. Heron Island J]
MVLILGYLSEITFDKLLIKKLLQQGRCALGVRKNV